MKKRWIAALAVISISAFGLMGCNKEGEAVVEETEVLTEEEIAAREEEQNKIIAEYAAGVLMKYNAGTNSRVLEGQKLLAEEAKEEVIRAKEERRKQLYEEYEGKEENQNTESGDNNSDKGNGGQQTSEPVNYIGDMSTAVNFPSFSITYSGYEVVTSYGGNETFFTMDAKEGKSLLVSKFLVTNIGGQAEELNILSKEMEFRLKLTDRTISAQRTMLLDDLTMYQGVLEAGETKELVILFEISNDAAADLSSMELVIEGEGQTNRMSMEGGDGFVADIPIEEENEESLEVSEVIPTVTEGESDTELLQPAETAEEESDASIITTVGSNNTITIETAD